MLQRAKTNPYVSKQELIIIILKFWDFSKPNNPTQLYVVFFGGKKNFPANFKTINTWLQCKKDYRKSDKTKARKEISKES